MEQRDYLLSSALYKAASGLQEALAAAKDWPDTEGLSRAEAEVRGALRRHSWPSPDEPRMFWREGNS